MNKKVSAIAAGAIMMIASACTSTTTSTSADTELEDAVTALQDEVDRLQTELDDAQSAENSSDQEVSSASIIPDPDIDENGTLASRDAALKLAADLGCEGAHEMDGRYMPCDSHEEGSTAIDTYEQTSSKSYPSDGLYDSVEAAEQAAQDAACEGTHEMDGQYMPCDEHGDYLENMEMIENAGAVVITENGMYATEEEALAAAAAAGCTGTHQMGDMWMMCSEHSEGEELAGEQYAEVDEVEEPEYSDGLSITITDPLAEISMLSKSSRKIQVEATYNGRPLESGQEVCITLYNTYGNSTGCTEGLNFEYSRTRWQVQCQRPINGSPKPYYSIIMQTSSGNELARIDVAEDSSFRC